MIPAVMLSHKLNISYTLYPELFSKDEILIVDDIVDSGKTLTRWEGYSTAAFHYKPHTSISTPTFYACKFKSDDWVVYPWENKDSKTIQDYKVTNVLGNG